MTDPTHLASDHLFAVGEVAIFWRPGGPNHGKELTILSGMQWRKTRGSSDGVIREGWRYLCDMPNAVLQFKSECSEKTWVAPEHLRKKRPPRDGLEVIRWDSCPWQPESINV
jgi:hypothetical protein